MAAGPLLPQGQQPGPGSYMLVRALTAPGNTGDKSGFPTIPPRKPFLSAGGQIVSGTLCPQYRRSGSSFTLTTTASVTTPDVYFAGDLLLLFAASVDSTVDTPSGWTLIPSLVGSGGGFTDARVFYRWADKTSDAPTVTTPAGTDGVAIIHAYWVPQTANSLYIRDGVMAADTDATSIFLDAGAVGTLNVVHDTDIAIGFGFGKAVTSFSTAPVGGSAALAGATIGQFTTRSSNLRGTTVTFFVGEDKILVGGSTTIKPSVQHTAGEFATGVVGGFVLSTTPTPASNQTVAVGTITETDTPVAINRVKIKALGTAIETDAPVALTRVKRRATGINTETDTPVTLARTKIRAVGVNAETDTSVTLTRVKRRGVGITTETDSPIPIVRGGVTHPVGTTTETDTPVALGRRKQRAPGINLETDTPVVLTRVKRRGVGITTETDAPVGLGRVKIRALGTAIETDTAVPLGRVHQRALGITTETDLARPASGRPQIVLALGTAVETDTAQPIPATTRAAILVRLRPTPDFPGGFSPARATDRRRRNTPFVGMWPRIRPVPVERGILLWQDGRVKTVTSWDDYALYHSADDRIAGGYEWTGAASSWQAQVLLDAGYSLEVVATGDEFVNPNPAGYSDIYTDIYGD